MTKIPDMVKDVLIFCDILRERALEGHIFAMDPLTINLNLDIIGRLALYATQFLERFSHD